MELRNDFEMDGHFRRDMLISQQPRLGCEKVSQQGADFAEAFFSLRNFTELCFSLVFALFWLRFRPDFFFFQSP